MKKSLAAWSAAFLLLCLALIFLPIKAKGQTGYTTLWSQWIQNSLIDSTPIGSNTPSTGAFSSLKDSALGVSTNAICTTTGGQLINSGCVSPTLQDEWQTVTANLTTSSSNTVTTTILTWTTPFQDSNYHIVCVPLSPLPGLFYYTDGVTSASQFNIQEGNWQVGGISQSTLQFDCHGHHN